MASDSKSDPPDQTPSDLPPESFRVSRDDVQDWFDRNAFMQRKTSFKLGNRSFKSFRPGRGDLPSSINTKLKSSVFGLIPKSHNPQERKPAATARFLFRSRSEPGGKATTEPASPRVSCTGRVERKGGDGARTGFTRLLSSLFRTRSGKYGSRGREMGSDS